MAKWGLREGAFWRKTKAQREIEKRNRLEEELKVFGPQLVLQCQVLDTFARMFGEAFDPLRAGYFRKDRKKVA